MRKLFTLLTVALVSTAAWAQFDEPELVKATSLQQDGTTEYILSVTNSEGDTYFYGKGNAWGTRTSAKMSADEALTVRFGVPAEDGTFRLNNYVSDKGGWGAYVDCDGGLQAWVDGQGRTGDGKWTLTDLGNGQIELANGNAVDGKFGLCPNRGVWSEDEMDYIVEEPEDAYGFDNRLWFIGAPVDSVDILNEEGEATGEKRARVVYGDEVYTTWQLWDASLYNLKKKISIWYWEEGGIEYADEDAAVEAAVEACNKVYDDPNCTVEALQAAYDKVLAAVGNIKVNENRDMLEGAEDTDPINLFEVGIMVNADFGGSNSDAGDLEGWTAQLRGNDNHRQGDQYSNGNVTISGFAESWTWNTSHSAGYGEFSQEVGLPAGLYILGVDMIATQQSTNKEGSTGVELFAKSSNGQEFAIPVATGNNAPEHFELAFVAQDGTFTVGVRENNTTCNWIAMDNWSLYYYGNTDKPLEQINLGKTITSIAERHDAHDEIIANKDIIDAYDAAYEAATAAYENGGLEDVAQYTVLGDSLTAKYNALSASMGDYRYFAQCMETVQGRIEEWESMNPACAAELADYYDELSEHYTAMDWTRAEMNEILPTVSDIMGKYTKVEPGDDVTFYLNNAKFTDNFSGWNLVGATPGYSKNHAQGENQNADLCQEVPDENDGLAECFHALFDMSQTIKNLPAGLYTLSVQGFNRHDDGNNESAVLYAKFSDGTEQTQDFASIDDYATEDKLYENGQWSSDAERNGLYAPNGMTGAAWHFVNKKDGENYDYTNKFSILMKEKGDLTVGVRVENTHQWVIWDNFTLVYEGSGPEVWISTLEDEITKLDNRCAEAGITSGQQTVIDEVIDEANALIKNIEGATEEDCQAMLTKLQAQYPTINENVALQAEAESMYDYVFAAEEKYYDEAEAELQARFDAVKGIFTDAEYDALDNEGIKAAIEELKAVVNLMKMPKGWQDASDENPVDFTAMILNPQFNVDGETYEDPEDEPAPVQNHNFTEWQGKQPGTGGGQPGNCGEVWNSGAFNMYQEIVGLPEGTYELSCQGFLRHGGGTADSYAILNGEKEQQVYAYLYANSAEGKYSTELQNIASVQLTVEALDSLGIDITPGNSTFGEIYKGADQLATADNFFKADLYHNTITVKVGADGVLRIGIEKVGAVGQDWVVVDNFSLVYYGNSSSKESSDDPKTAIDAVETTAQKAIFTITGLRVNKMAKPGLYIINGKKVLVK